MAAVGDVEVVWLSSDPSQSLLDREGSEVAQSLKEITGGTSDTKYLHC